MTAMGLGTATQTQLYLYDKNGLRFTQKAATSTLVYASPQFNATINASGTRIDTEKHASYGAQLLATIDGTGIAARILYQHPDHLSGANAITNEARGFEEVLDYMPFGGVRVDAKLGSWSEQRKYAGHEFDDASGYSYMKARYYEPGVKRFLGEDEVFWSVGYPPTDPQQANSYSYSRNTPITHVDPDGKLVMQAYALYSLGRAVLADPIGAGQFASRFVPLYGDALDVAEVASGKDFYSGENLSKADRGLTVIGVALPAVIPGKLLREGKNVLRVLSDSRAATRSYRSFEAFKRAEGVAGEGMQWHHIVEQNPYNKTQFSPELLQSTDNLVSIPTELHQQISGWYSRTSVVDPSLRNRDVISRQSFSEQAAIGNDILNRAKNGTLQ